MRDGIASLWLGMPIAETKSFGFSEALFLFVKTGPAEPGRFLKQAAFGSLRRLFLMDGARGAGMGERAVLGSLRRLFLMDGAHMGAAGIFLSLLRISCTK